jgi:cell wall-associated NlpC family hydrolase
MLLIDEARSWIGTKFQHQGRIKKQGNDVGGCDCLGLIMGLGVKTKGGKLLSHFDQKSYPKALSSDILLTKLSSLLKKSDKLSPGNILLIKIENWPQHLAIISEICPYIRIIHSYAQAKKVVEQHLPETWKNSIVAVFESNI